jgi:hypothetical protein
MDRTGYIVAMLPSPPPLRPEASPAQAGSWLRHHAAGLVALTLGALAFIVVTLQPQPLWAAPDWRITVPFLLATLVAAVVSFARKEGTPVVPLLGVGIAASTLVLGWFFVVAAVVAVTVSLMLILTTVM